MAMKRSIYKLYRPNISVKEYDNNVEILCNMRKDLAMRIRAVARYSPYYIRIEDEDVGYAMNRGKMGQELFKEYVSRGWTPVDLTSTYNNPLGEL